jgi:O-6-methylguanine DNA methyltransferase
MVRYGFLEPHPEFATCVATGDRGIVRLEFGAGRERFLSEAQTGKWIEDGGDPLIREAGRQLAEYFRGNLRRFDLPLELRGTPFQVRVWHGLLSIPYGETRSYSELANALGTPGAARAVGGANHANPVAIIVPCHRVINRGGGLGGYGGGLERKKFLLELERGRAAAGVAAS